MVAATSRRTCSRPWCVRSRACSNASIARRSKGLLLEEAAPDDVVEPIRRRVVETDWVGEPTTVHAVYVGPSSLLVNIVVAPAGREEPAGALIEKVDRLRSELEADPSIAHVTVTLTAS